MYLVNDYLVFDFPYHAEMVNEIKGITGAKWDKVEKLWKVPLTSISQAREFALKHNFNLTNEIMRFIKPYLGNWISKPIDWNPSLRGVPEKYHKVKDFIFQRFLVSPPVTQ